MISEIDTAASPLQADTDAVAGWPGVSATVHWDLFDGSRVDGVDFYCIASVS